jgi:LysM repeat protein
MDRLGLVAAPGGRTWRAYAAPAAALLAAIVVVAVLRGGLGGGHASRPTRARTATQTAAKPHRGRTLYVVRAGDTIEAISARTGVSEARLLRLNPRISPTALFIGEKLNLR